MPDYITINNIDYLILDEITINNIRYVYLSEEDNPLNFMVRKVVLEDNTEYLVGLDTDIEIKTALNAYFTKHKEEIN